MQVCCASVLELVHFCPALTVYASTQLVIPWDRAGILNFNPIKALEAWDNFFSMPDYRKNNHFDIGYIFVSLSCLNRLCKILSPLRKNKVSTKQLALRCFCIVLELACSATSVDQVGFVYTDSYSTAPALLSASGTKITNTMLVSCIFQLPLM